MNVSDLSPDELLVFIGLARLLINIDDLVSLPELKIVRALTDEIGREAWHEAATQAKQRFRGLDGALEAAGGVERAEARAFILEQLTKIAAADELIPQEEVLLRKLQAVWA